MKGCLSRGEIKDENSYRWRPVDDEDAKLCAGPCGGPQFCVGDICSLSWFVHTLPPAVAIQSNSTFQDRCLGNHVLYCQEADFLLLFHKRLIQEMSLKALNLKADVRVDTYTLSN